MRGRIALLAIALVFVPDLNQARDHERVSIGILETTAKTGISQDLADMALDLLAAEIDSLGNVQVNSRFDTLSILNLKLLRPGDRPLGT